MKNVFLNAPDEELKEIYKDYLGSKELGIGVSSFKEYARKINKEYLSQVDYPLGMTMNLVERMFFDEIANRYFKERKD